MVDIIGVAIQTLISNPLTVSLIILGVLCVALAIIGKIPPMNIEGVRAVMLAGFGILLIIISVVLALILTSPSTSTASQQPTTSATASSGNSPTTSPSQIVVMPSPTTTSECTPPNGLVPLWKSDPIWSVGLWGSPNVVNFKSALGEIDTNDPDYGEFSIWIDPCYAGTVPGHGYTDGGRFWAKQTGIGVTSSPIPLGGSEATIINDIPANTGIWGLGPRY